MTLAILAKAIAISVCAAAMATLYFVAALVFDTPLRTGAGYSLASASRTFMPSLMGSFAIGLPVALMTYFLSGKHLAQSPLTVAMVAVLAGVMMILTSYALGDEEAVRILGIPAFIAALTYGILGWFWILKPLRKVNSQ